MPSLSFSCLRLGPLAGILAVSVSTALAAPVLTLRQGPVIEQGGTLRTAAAHSAAEAKLPASGILRLAGIGSTTTGGPLRLETGQALLSSSRTLLGRRSIESTLGPVNLNLRGTALLSALPGQPVKITVLEGTATARLAGRRSHFTEIPAGSMLMLSDSDSTLPAPSEIRLFRLRQSSGLLGRPFETLPADPDMQKAIVRQEKELSRKRLLASNIKVRGSRATLDSDNGGTADDTGNNSSSGSGSSSGNSGNSSSGGSSSSSSSSSASSSSGGAAGGRATGALHCVGCASHATPIGAVSANDSNRIAQIRAEDAAAGISANRSGPSVPGVKVSAAITFPGSETASRGDLDSAPAATTTITVANSSDLNALAQAVILASFGENITVSQSSFARQPGVINLDAGTIFERTLSLDQSTFTGDIIKARSFSTPGTDALLITGGAFNAGQLIRLYAEGGGALRFRGDVTLTSPNAELAGSVVQIDPGSTVRATGNVRIFSDDHRYDREGFGALQSPIPKTALPFAARPRY